MSTPSHRETSTWRVLRSRNVGLYFAGNVASATGTWFQNLAQAVLIFRLTGSTFFVALVNFAQFAGVVLMAPWSGSAADRFNRRRLIIVTQVISAAIAAAMALLEALGLVTAPVLIGAALVLGLALAFNAPAQQALVPLLVEPKDLAPAVAINSTTFNLARAIGPVLATLVIAKAGFAWAFALNSLSFLLFVALILAIRPREQKAVAPGSRPKLRDGLALVKADRRLIIFLAVITTVALAGDPVNTLTPGFSVHIYGRADTFAGILIGAFGVGAVAAATVVGRMRRSFTTMIGTVGLIAVGLIIFALSPSPIGGLIGLLVAGFGFLSSTATATTLLHLTIEDSYRGRIMALWSVAFLGVRPLASLVDGTAATLIGLHGAGLVMSLFPLAMVVILLTVVRRRKLVA